MNTRNFLVSAVAIVAAASTAQAGWQQDALVKQYNLQKHTPLVAANIIGTHNSYSSNAYNMKLYENQNMSITDQLNEGARFLELDLWRNTELEYVSTILCHNGGRCGIWTSDYIYTDTALREIAEWARNNRDQVIVIKLEDQMDDASYHYFAEAIQRTLGDIVYRPPRNSDEGRVMFPADLTAADMLSLGKQIIFQGYGGASDNPIGRGWVFGTTNSERDGGDVIDARATLLNCGDHANGRYALFYDSAAEDDFSSDKFVPTDMIQPLMRCGGTVFGFDWLTTNDSRSRAAIWSWAENEPNNAGDEDCAVSHDGRFNDVSCSQSFAYLCHDGQQWQVSSGEGSWEQGNATCAAEFGSAYRFDVPRTASQNQQAEAARQRAEKTHYWLHYSDRENEGYWLTGDDSLHLAGSASTAAALQVTSWNRYDLVYADTGTGGDNNISIWRGKDLPAGWYRLGDVVGLATSGSYAYTYSRKPGSSLIAYDDGSGLLAKPLSYDWRWNDWKTGGDQDVTLWSPVAPDGYTCLGDIAVPIDSRVQPSTDLVRCVRDDLLLDGSSLWEWSDAGSGGAYNATIYLTTTQLGHTVNSGVSPNGFDVNVTNSRKVFNRNKIHWLAGPEAVIGQPQADIEPAVYRELLVMGHCMDANPEDLGAAVNGTSVYVWDCWNPAAWQKWIYDSNTGFIRSKHNPSMCLDATHGNSAATEVKMWRCEDHINLKWDWVGNTIRPRKNHNLALDLSYGATNNGQKLWLWDVHGGPAQSFSWGAE